MTRVGPIQRNDAEAVAALWRALHPDWAWLDDPEWRAHWFESGQALDRIGHVVRRADALIATVSGTLVPRDKGPPTRLIRIEARPDDIARGMARRHSRVLRGRGPRASRRLARGAS